MLDKPEPCRVCQGRKWIAPDITQLGWFQQRYQWADLSYGCNDCPGCVQVPPAETSTVALIADPLPR